MKTRFLIIIAISSIVVVSVALTFIWGFAVDETEKFKSNLDDLILVKNCVPALLDDAPVPEIPIMNDTHKFDLRTCEWIELE